MMWLDDGLSQKYPMCCAEALKLLLPFPTSYLVESGFSTVKDLLTKKRNSLCVDRRGDLRIKLTNIHPDFDSCANAIKHKVHIDLI